MRSFLAFILLPVAFELDLGDDILLVTIGQSTQEAYNYLVGGQWDVNRSISILAEFGFGKRKSQMLNFTYRV